MVRNCFWAAEPVHKYYHDLKCLIPLRLLTFLCNYFRKPYAFLQTAQKEGFFRQPPVKYDPVLFFILVRKPFAIMYGNSHPLHYKYRPTSSFRGCIPGCQASAIRGKSPLPGSGRERFSNKLGRYAEPSTTSWGEWPSQMSVSKNPSAKLDDFRCWKWKIVRLCCFT